MTKLTESHIETRAIELLQNQGYHYFHGADIAPESENPLRTSFEEVILSSLLQQAIDRINPDIPAIAREDALHQVIRIHSPQLITSNETFHRMLTEGINVKFQQGSESRGEYVWLIDFDRPENNTFHVVNQFTISEHQQNKRPDLILFINGLPLVVIELKNAADEHASIRSAFQQLQTYKQAIPSLFTYNSILVISDGLEALAGSVSAG